MAKIVMALCERQSDTWRTYLGDHLTQKATKEVTEGWRIEPIHAKEALVSCISLSAIVNCQVTC